MNKVDGLHHAAFCTSDMKGQIEFFTDKLGMELQALYWMHGFEKTFHGFLRLNDESSIAFVQNPAVEQIPVELGKTHAGNPAAICAKGTLQHISFRVKDYETLLAMRDRLRKKGVPVLGPVDHGMSSSMYFAGLENLSLELACSSEPINPEAWIDQEVVELCGISKDELEKYKGTSDFDDENGSVPQPPLDNCGPHMTNYPDGAYKKLMHIPDQIVWDSSENEPPNKIDVNPEV